MNDELFYRVTSSLCAAPSWNGMLGVIAIGAWIAFVWGLIGLWNTNWRVQAYLRWAHIFLSLGVALYPTLIMLLRMVAIDCDDSQTILRLMPSWPAMHLLVKFMSVVTLIFGVTFFWRAWRVPMPLFDDPIVDDELAKLYVLSTRKNTWSRLRSVFTDQALYMDDAYAQLRDSWNASWENFLDYRSRQEDPLDLQSLSMYDRNVLSSAVVRNLHQDISYTDAALVTSILIDRGLTLEQGISLDENHDEPEEVVH